MVNDDNEMSSDPAADAADDGARAGDAADESPTERFVTEEPVDAIAETPAGAEAFWAQTLPMVELDRRDRWVEIFAAALLSLALLAGVWSAAQAVRWGSEQTRALAVAAASRADAASAADEAASLRAIDVATWLDWLDAIARDDLPQVAIVEERMRPELGAAIEAWLESAGTTPGNIPPGTPFDADASGASVHGYAIAAADASILLGAEAVAAVGAAADASDTRDDYVIAGVAFAAVLFFAAVGSKFRSLQVRFATLGVGSAAFVLALLFVLSLDTT